MGRRALPSTRPAQCRAQSHPIQHSHTSAGNVPNLATPLGVRCPVALCARPPANSSVPHIREVASWKQLGRSGSLGMGMEWMMSLSCRYSWYSSSGEATRGGQGGQLELLAVVVFAEAVALPVSQPPMTSSWSLFADRLGRSFLEDCV